MLALVSDLEVVVGCEELIGTSYGLNLGVRFWKAEASGMFSIS